MSYTTLYAIGNDGQIAEDFEFRNSHGSAPYVWREMAARYCGGEDAYYMMMARDGDDGMRRVWNLWKDPSVPIHQRAVMAFTFDHVMVRAGDFHRLAADMDAFVADFNPGDKACSLPQQAETLRILSHRRGGYRAACWQQTSVSGDAWSGPYDSEREEEVRPYNIDLDDKHWFLYEALDALDAAD